MRFILLIITLMMGPTNLLWAQDPEPTEKLSEKPPAEDYSKKLILFPIVYYTPETRLAAGGLFIKNLWKEKEGHTSHIMGTVSFTANNQVMTTMSPRLYFDQGDWELGGMLFYSYFPNKYYGRGVDNSLKTPEKYTENNFLASINGGKNIFKNLFLRGGASQDYRKIIDYEVGGLIQNEIQTWTANLQVLSVNAGLEWDERDYPQSPRQGAWYRATQAFYEPLDREGQKSLERFRKIDFDFRQYVTLAPRWMLAGQLVASEIQGDQVPFQYLNSLGGGSRMRGFYAGQHRDKSLGMLQSELRFEKNLKWTPTAFFSIARMATTISDLNTSDSFYSGGVGIQYTLDPENRTKLRLDFGFNGRERGTYFLIGDAF